MLAISLTFFSFQQIESLVETVALQAGEPFLMRMSRAGAEMSVTFNGEDFLQDGLPDLEVTKVKVEGDATLAFFGFVEPGEILHF